MFGIVVYISRPKDVEELVTNLFDIVLAKADKIYLVTVNLYDRLDSAERTYKHSLSSVKEAYEKRSKSSFRNLRVIRR